jgi:hypothetical protein
MRLPGIGSTEHAQPEINTALVTERFHFMKICS